MYEAVLLSKKKKLLLVDLDGVLIASSRPETRKDQILYPLHGHNTGQDLAKSSETIAVLTHRHKAEAGQILKLLGLDLTHIARCYSAQDLWHCAIRYNQILATIIGGMKKSLILPLIKAELGYHPPDIAMIDDRPDILSDMSNHGVGLTLLAPYQLNDAYNSDHTITFDLSEALRVFEKWSHDTLPESMQHVILKERVIQTKNLPPINNIIVRKRWDLFSLARKTAHVLRRSIIQ